MKTYLIRSHLKMIRPGKRDLQNATRCSWHATQPIYPAARLLLLILSLLSFTHPPARLIGRTTVNAASATISVAGRTNAGVVVITAGPRVTTESGPVAVIAAPRIGVDGAEAGPGAVINRGSLCPKAVPRDDAEEPELLRVVVVVDTELVGGEWWFLEVSPRSLHC
jgi:hypothetical protein